MRSRSTVHTKATFVVADSEAKRLYGSQWKTERALGTEGTTRSQYVVVASWKLSSGTVVHGVLKMNVKQGTPPPLDADGNILHHGRHTESYMADRADVATKSYVPEQEDVAVANQSTPRLEVFHKQRAVHYPESVLIHEQECKRSQHQSFINDLLPTKTWRDNCGDGTIVAQRTEWCPRKALD